MQPFSPVQLIASLFIALGISISPHFLYAKELSTAASSERVTLPGVLPGDKADLKIENDSDLTTSEKDHAYSVQKPARFSPATEAAEPLVKEKQTIRWVFGDSIVEVTNRLRIEGLYGVNLRLLNDANNARDPKLDKIIFPGRHTFDSWFLYSYGFPSKGYDVVKVRCGVRNRGIWGNEMSILPTSPSNIKHVDAFLVDPGNAIPRHLFWARELWIEMTLNDIFGVDWCTRHTFTAGLFPFSLGRGIALGDAYEIDPDFVGFYTTSGIDQFAPGFKLSGEILPKDVLRYDLYVEIAENQSESFATVNQPINSQRFGRAHNPARGFGILDYILAGRLMWKPYDKDDCRVYLEPYALYAEDREQKIEFIGDARFHFGTVGLAGEFEYGNWEGGFDTAFQVGGNQEAFGWDRNIITEENRNGFDAFVYDHIKELPAGTEPTREALREAPNVLVTKETKKIANITSRVNNEGEQFNGKFVGTITRDTKTFDLYNSINRFTDPFCNKIQGGAMFVCDAAYNFVPSKVKLAATAGFATGDEDPNKDLNRINESTRNGQFKGFVGLQELYSGKRVRSLLVMAGQGRFPRPLSIPDFDEVNQFPSNVTRFSNLALVGAGAQFSPKFCEVVWDIRPNVLAFWAYKAPQFIQKIRDAQNNVIERRRRTADNYLGTELNITIEGEVIKDLKLFVNGALFIPGSFYSDLRGTPLSKDERTFLESIGTPNEGLVTRVPTLGDDPAYFLGAGLEYKF